MQTLTVANGASVTAPDLVLVRRGVITGRVEDEYGEPVIRAAVSAVGRAADGAGPLGRAGGSVMTDDRGRYRLYGLAEGRYTVHVVPRAEQLGGAFQGDRRELLPAFATSTTEIAAAEFVQVSDGTETTLDARLPRGRRVLVTGRVLPDGDAPLGECNVTLRSADPRLNLAQAGSRVGPDGRFGLQDVPSGRYLLVAEEFVPASGAHPSGMAAGRTGWTEVLVDDDDVADVTVPIGPGATIQGRIDIEGATPGALGGRALRVAASRPREHPVAGRHVETKVAPDLAFTLTGLHGRQHLQVGGLPEGWWVKAITVGGRDAIDGHEFPRRGTFTDVVVLVSAALTGVSGRVEGGSDALDGAFVLAVPEHLTMMDALHRSQELLRAVQPDGTFAVRGLRPGRYVVAALTPEVMAVHRGEALEEQLEFLRSAGVIVDVQEERMPSIALRLMDVRP